MNTAADSSPEVLVHVQGVSKKFCRDLKKSLWYGVRDLATELKLFQNRTPGKDQHSGARAYNTLREAEFWAVNNVSFDLRRGECLGLIGHNGAGKTTLLKLLNGLIKPDAGRIEMGGRVGALIALGAGFNPILTGRENIYVTGSILGLSKAEIDAQVDEIIDFAEIRGFIDAPVQSYSSGMAVRLGFAVAAKCQPDVLLLDEVLAVGDVGFQAKCFNCLSEFRRRGTAFVLVSHNMHQISRYCDRVLYLKQGGTAHLGNVETGISYFIQDTSSTDAAIAGELTDWSEAYGSGKVVLKRATFLNDTGELIDEMTPGSSFSLVIDYECPGEDVDDAILDIIIRDKEGILFQGASADYGVDFGKLLRAGTFIIAFDCLPTNSAELQFFFALLGKQHAEIYDWRRYVRLKVHSNPKLTGRLALRVAWKATSAGQFCLNA
jgi:ABC-type polysaccharide/polyol phosphate transport system ATPase subunit